MSLSLLNADRWSERVKAKRTLGLVYAISSRSGRYKSAVELQVCVLARSGSSSLKQIDCPDDGVIDKKHKTLGGRASQRHTWPEENRMKVAV